MDRALLDFFNRSLARSWLDGPMVVLTVFGLLLVPVIAWWPRRRRTADARALSNAALLAMLIGVVAAVVVQLFVDRARPADVRLVLAQPALFPSFPSGHVAAAMAVALVLLLGRATRRLGVAASLLAGLLGLSRVYLGHHFPSDVLGGAMLGAGIGASCHGLFARAGEPARWRWLLFGHLAAMAVVTQMAYLGLVPSLPSIVYIDKIGHLLFFGIATFLLDPWFAPQRRWLYVPPAIALPFCAGFVEEMLQMLSPYRTCDVLDLTADLVGMLAFFALSRLLRARLWRGSGSQSDQSPAQQPPSIAA
ncbi:MAG: VanZ family protein [Myxococcales bacterium]|nr:VanZ family protein [Myxococcales bacterium]